MQLVERLPPIDELVDATDVGTSNRIVADDHEHLEVGAHTPELGMTEAGKYPSVARGSARHVADHHAVRRRLVLKARRHVSDVTEHRRVHSAASPQFAHDCQAGVDTDP